MYPYRGVLERCTIASHTKLSIGRLKPDSKDDMLQLSWRQRSFQVRVGWKRISQGDRPPALFDGLAEVFPDRLVRVSLKQHAVERGRPCIEERPLPVYPVTSQGHLTNRCMNKCFGHPKYVLFGTQSLPSLSTRSCGLSPCKDLTVGRTGGTEGGSRWGPLGSDA